MNPVETLLRYLPWRYQSLGNWRYTNANRLFRRVLSTPPMACRPDAHIEVHSLVCRRDFYMYLMAAKSFLHYCPDVLLVVHDDGSLTEQDAALLNQHLPGSRFISRASADQELRPLLPEYIANMRTKHVFMLKLFDFNLLNKGGRTLILDSDILFINRPDEVLEWIDERKTNVFYNQDPLQITCRTEPIPPAYPLHFNAGFIGLPAALTLEQILQTVEPLDYYAEDQSLYGCLCQGMQAKALPKNRYFVRDGGSLSKQTCMIHFISSYRFTDSLYVKLSRKVIEQLSVRAM